MNHKDDMKDIQYYSPLKTTDLTKILSFTGKKILNRIKERGSTIATKVIIQS